MNAGNRKIGLFQPVSDRAACEYEFFGARTGFTGLFGFQRHFGAGGAAAHLSSPPAMVMRRTSR